MVHYIVSIEAMYSQSVGNYEFLCDNMESVSYFRQVLRAMAYEARDSEGHDENDEETGYEFFESVYILDDGALNEELLGQLQNNYDENYKDDLEVTARCVFSKRYEDFHWLEYKMMTINYEQTKSWNKFDCLPLLNHVHDYVEVVHNIPVETFITSFVLQKYMSDEF